MATIVLSSNWFTWAHFSAVFAALTVIFAKIGLAGVDSDFATLIRTVIIFGVFGAFVYATGKWSNPLELSGKTWLCYLRALKIGDASMVAPVDKLSVLR